MAFPIATTKPGGICFAFPDVCLTPVGSATPAIPYPNTGQLADAMLVSDDKDGSGQGAVLVGGFPIILQGSQILQTTGDEAGSAGVTKGKVEFTQGSTSVLVHGQPVIRMFDPTLQNNGNAVGQVLGGEPTVLVGP